MSRAQSVSVFVFCLCRWDKHSRRLVETKSSGQETPCWVLHPERELASHISPCKTWYTNVHIYGAVFSYTLLRMSCYFVIFKLLWKKKYRLIGCWSVEGELVTATQMGRTASIRDWFLVRFNSDNDCSTYLDPPNTIALIRQDTAGTKQK